MSRINDLTGRSFGRLTVIKRGEDQVSESGRHRVRWLCSCDCGKECLVLTDNLVSGRQVSCGCFSREQAIKSHITHGDSKSPLYGIWCAMKNRCYNRNQDAYIDYGARGIIVCDEWRHNFSAFKEWAYLNGYDPSKHGSECSIDRADVNGNYEPSNCRWVDGVAQANNRRSNRLYSYDGETHNIKEWSVIKGIPYKRLHNRLRSGWTIEKALTT